MGLQTTVQNLVGTAFTAIGDLSETLDYVHEGDEPVYDETTGSVTSDPTTSTVSVRAVLIPFNSKVAENLPGDLVEIARPGDEVALIPGKDMTIQPTTGDKLVRATETWRVKGFTRDPAEGLWKILVKRVGGGA